MDVSRLLEKLISKNDMDSGEATWMMERFMEGDVLPSQMAALLVALRIKGETVTEIAACANVMRQKSTKVDVATEELLDTCGTGGDASGSFNISTTVALLLAGGGYRIAKHGNRSMTSKSGSADLLEALGVNINLTPEQVGQCINEAGIGFLFAPALHSAMKNVVPVRKELAVRTVFNVLGPLTNPAGAPNQIIGLFSPVLVPKIIHVLKELGARSAYVFSGNDGLDEISISGPSTVARLESSGEIKTFEFNPTDFGFKLADLSDIKGGSAEENAAITRQIFSGEEKGAKRDIVMINAGFAISALKDCELKEGFDIARQLLDEGAGTKAIEKLVSVSHNL